MTIFQAILFFAVCWWLVLFMVLPWGVRMADKPQSGHAASAPVNPRLRRKMLITTGITLFLAITAYYATSAQAASGMYHAGGNDCAEPADLAADATTNATGDVDLPGSANPILSTVPTYLDAPANAVTGNQALQDRLGGGVVSMGMVTTDTRTGETRLNGEPLNSPSQRPEHCQ